MHKRCVSFLILVCCLLAGSTAVAQRVTNDLQVLYRFNEGGGTNVPDVSGVDTPLDLTIQDTNAVQWLIGGGLVVESPTIIKAAGAASKIVDGSKNANAISVEAWIRPENTQQTGPAAIVTLSEDPANRNFTLGQEGDLYNFRLRTTTTGNNGTNPQFLSGINDVTTEATHVVVTRNAAGEGRFYVNGKLVKTTLLLDGDLSTWNAGYSFALANEVTEDANWRGTYYLVAVYSRALSASNVVQNYTSGDGPSEEVKPGFYAEPSDVTVTEPSAATFSVSAGGTAPLSYQWRREGTNIAGATSTEYTLDPTATNDSGAQFDVVVSNTFGVATSRVATLTVNELVPAAPSITSEPEDVVVTEPDSAAFTVTAEGTAPLAYQWTRNGNPLPGAINAYYILNPTSTADDGAEFRVVVTNVYGAVTSRVATLTVNPYVAHPPSISSHPQDVDVFVPTPASFSVTATGDEPLSYQWRRDGTLLAGEKSTVYTLDPTALEDDGARFDVVVSNGTGVVTSQVAILTARESGPQPPRIDRQPEDREVAEPTAAEFSVEVSGDAPLYYQWRRDTNALSGATASSYTLDPTAVTDSGAQFDVIVSNAYGVVTSQVATLTVNPPPVAPVITQHPTNTTVVEGSEAAFSVTATGDEPLTYAWYRNGTLLSGATSNRYTLNPARLTDNGALFHAVVGNVAGTATSTVAELTVEAAPVPPEITMHPADRTVQEPDGVIFSVRAKGDPPLSCQWRRNGTNIAGATSWDYTLDPTVRTEDDGARFDAVVSSPVGVATSDMAVLNVASSIQPPAVTLHPSDRTVAEPDEVIFSVRATGDPPLAYQWRKNGAAIAGATAQDYVLSPTVYLTDDGAQFDAVVSNGGGTATSDVAVLTVTALPNDPVLASDLPPSDMRLEAVVQRDHETRGSAIDLWNSGTGTLSYNVTSSVPWLSVSPASGTCTDEIDTLQVYYSAIGLTTGIYSGMLSIQSPEAPNAPFEIGITMTVVAATTARNDFDGDGRSDLGVYYPPLGKWYMFASTTGFYENQFGFDGTVPITGDFDGDGVSDLGVYYAPLGKWYIFASTTGFYENQFGYAGTIPITGDFDGDGRDDFGCYHPPSGDWYMFQSTEGFRQTQFGFSGTIPVTGDFDGDGLCDFGYYHPASGAWKLAKSTGGFIETQFGFAGTTPIVGDFDGDGIDDFGVYYAPLGKWYIFASTRGFYENQFGYDGTLPVVGDFDGDGRADIGCYYAPGGNWYIFGSASGFYQVQFGYAGTLPLGAPAITP